MLKTKTIKTDKATLLVVELPECRGVVSDNQGKRICFHTEKGWDWIWQPNGMFGKLKLLGRLPDITEEQAAKVIPTIPIQKGKTKRYITAKEAMHSLLESEGVYFENPLGEKPNYTSVNYGLNPDGLNKYDADLSEWQTAQEQVWDKQRVYFFKMIE